MSVIPSGRRNVAERPGSSRIIADSGAGWAERCALLQPGAARMAATITAIACETQRRECRNEARLTGRCAVMTTGPGKRHCCSRA
jgi:hypothetical protein